MGLSDADYRTELKRDIAALLAGAWADFFDGSEGQDDRRMTSGAGR